MKKSRFFFTALLCLFSTSVLAESNSIPKQCEQLFKETENLIAQAEKKQPGTHIQVNKIKSKLNQSKQQILQMELATQLKVVKWV